MRRDSPSPTWRRQLRSQNMDVPSGSIKEGVRDYAVRALGQFQSMDEIRGLRIDTPQGTSRCATWPRCSDTVAEPADLCPHQRAAGRRHLGPEAVRRQHGHGCRWRQEEAASCCSATRRSRGSCPRDIKAVISYDTSERVKEAIYDVRDALMWGALLAALVVFLFLHNFRGTIIVALAIPTCILMTFLPIGLGLGFTLNMMVMLGLALSVGILG